MLHTVFLVYAGNESNSRSVFYLVVAFPVWTGGGECATIEQSIIISILSRKSINIISLSIPDSISRNLNASDSENSREVLWKAETDRSENLLHSKYKGGSMGKTDIVTKNYMRGSDIFADAFNIIYSKNSPSSTGGR